MDTRPASVVPSDRALQQLDLFWPALADTRIGASAGRTEAAAVRLGHRPGGTVTVAVVGRGSAGDTRTLVLVV